MGIKDKYFDTPEEAIKYITSRPPRTYFANSSEKTVLDLAYERIYRAYELFDTIAVGFSGGKDSTACFNLTLKVAQDLNKLPLHVFFWDEEAIPYQTENYVRRVAKIPEIRFRWFCLPVKHRNACSRNYPYWSPWDPACQELWVRSMPPEATTYLKGFPMGGEPGDRLSIPDSDGLLYPPGEFGNVGLIMGIRAQESMIRRSAVLRRKEENYIMTTNNNKTNPGNVFKVYPIYDWTDNDVWTAPVKLGWDYNEAYDVLTQAGIDPHNQRCSPAFGEEPMEGFDRFKTCFPEIWGKMTMRVPGANAAVRYAKTELWGYNEPIQKPDGVSWQEHIAQLIEKFPEDERWHVASNIRMLINRHYGKTTDPILPYTAHPLTGMSWKYLASMAVRGDFKERRRFGVANKIAKSEEKYLNRWEKYCQEREKEGL